MLRWRKLGHVFNPATHAASRWMNEYAQCPVPFVVDDRSVRVLFACRPHQRAGGMPVSCPAYVDLDRSNLSRLTGFATGPSMALGDLGTFDEFGVTPTSAVQGPDGLNIYYTGWTRMQSVPYAMAIGLAVSRDDGRTMRRTGPGPVFGPTVGEPYLQSGGVVRQVGEKWHLWYLTGRGWVIHDGKAEAVYQLAHATSTDRTCWIRDGRSIIASEYPDECQVSFALFRRRAKWHAVFSYRQATGFRGSSPRAYRLGHATSDDLETWVRDDAALGLDVSSDGWDSQMMCYPHALEIDGRVYLFYCGNDFGRHGFGIAELLE